LQRHCACDVHGESESVVACGSGSSVEEIREAIERYLRGHPEAADTAKGIATCWLREQGIEASRELVIEALESLVAQRKIDAFHLPDGDVLYERGRRTAGVSRRRRSSPKV
jgi:hypothetical protein